MITGLSHVSIVVPDIEAAARQLHEKYGLEVGPRMLNAEQGVRLAYVELGAAKIELMEPSRPDSPVAKFLERNPKGGIHHFSSRASTTSRNPRTVLPRMASACWASGKPQHNVAGERIAFIHPGDFLGALVELEEHKI